MDEALYFVIALILIIGAFMIWLIGKGSKNKPLNQERYRSKWLEIENNLDKDKKDTYSMCIIRADSLLDEAMKEKNYLGSTMGERLKSADKQFKNVNAVWTAHKLRNKLVHESGYHPSYEITKQTLNIFKYALRDLRAI